MTDRQKRAKKKAMPEPAIVELLERGPAAGARLVASALLASAADEAKAWRKKQTPSALHHFRTSLRRTRAWFRAWAPELEELDGVEKKLQRLARATGPARDAHVQKKRLDAEAEALGPDGATAAEKVRRRLKKLSKRSRGEALWAAERFVRLEKKLARRARTYRARLDAGDLPRRTLANEAALVLQAHVDELVDRLGGIEDRDDEEPIHKARITAKRLRYVLEPLAPHLPAAARFDERFKSLTNLLGELHDLHVWRAQLKGTRAKDQEVAAGLARLLERAEAQLDSRFAELRRTVLRGGAARLGREVRVLGAELAVPGARASTP